MSLVTNVILTCGEYSDDRALVLAALNSYDSGYACPSFAEVGDHAAGPKAFEAEIFIGAFNYLDEGKLAAHLRGMKWDFPSEVAVFIKRQDDRKFAPWTLYQSVGRDEDGEEMYADVAFSIKSNGIEVLRGVPNDE